MVKLPLVVAPPVLELSAGKAPTAENEVEFDGVWRTMSWDGAQAEAGDKLLPHIDGLPVLQVQVQSNEQGKQPLMVVAQQLSSGEMIRTIEGPAGDVSHLLAQRTMTDPKPAPPSSTSGSAGVQAYRSYRSDYGHAAGRSDARNYRRLTVRQSAGNDPAAERGDEE